MHSDKLRPNALPVIREHFLARNGVASLTFDSGAEVNGNLAFTLGPSAYIRGMRSDRLGKRGDSAAFLGEVFG